MPRGLTRRLPTVLLAAALAGALVTTGCADEAAAAHVGDKTISDDQLMTQVEALYGNNKLWQAIDQQNGQQPGSSRSELRGDAPGSFKQSFVATILQDQITFELIDQLFADEDLEVTDDYRQAAEQAQQDRFGEFFADFPKHYRDQQLSQYARLVSVQDNLGDGYGEALMTLIDETDIDVSSRYGSWDPEAFKAQFSDNATSQLAVVPPPGPAPAPGSDPAGAGD